MLLPKCVHSVTAIDPGEYNEMIEETYNLYGLFCSFLTCTPFEFIIFLVQIFFRYVGCNQRAATASYRDQRSTSQLAILPPVRLTYICFIERTLLRSLLYLLIFCQLSLKTKRYFALTLVESYFPTFIVQIYISN